MLKFCLLGLLLLRFLQFAKANEELNFKRMKMRELKKFLADRDVPCEGCIEKKHWVKTAMKNKDKPVVEKKPEPAPEKTEEVSFSFVNIAV